MALFNSRWIHLWKELICKFSHILRNWGFTVWIRGNLIHTTVLGTGIISPINHFQRNPCLRLCFWGRTHPASCFSEQGGDRPCCEFYSEAASWGLWLQAAGTLWGQDRLQVGRGDVNPRPGITHSLRIFRWSFVQKLPQCVHLLTEV